MDIKTTKKSYLDILKYYSKDEFRNEYIFHNNINQETQNDSYNEDEHSSLNINVELFFSLLFSNKSNYFYNINDKYFNENIYKKELENFEEKLITKLKKEKKQKTKNTKKQHLFLNNGYKKIEHYFFSNKKNKTCTICLINNDSEYLEKCKSCSLYFHAYCYKTFCDSFNLNNFICDVCLESNNYKESRNDRKCLDDNYNIYHFAYLNDDNRKEKINEVNINKNKETYSYLKKINKYMSDNELNYKIYKKGKKLKYLIRKKCVKNFNNGYQSETISNRRNFTLSQYYYENDVKVKKHEKFNNTKILNNYNNTSINHIHKKIKTFKEDCKEEIKCGICEKTNKNVIMKKKQKNLWFHLCCLYYNDITKNNSMLHIYFEYFFFNHYNEDYFINLYDNLKSVNDIIIKKIKTELSNNFNIITNNHSFNFLMNPYYYNLTIKQIKNLIYYNFILNNNTLNQNYYNLNNELNYNTNYNKGNDKVCCSLNDNNVLKNITTCNLNYLHNDISNINKGITSNYSNNNKEFLQEKINEDKKKKGNLTNEGEYNLQNNKEKNFIYCSDINNYNIISEENYFMNDILYITNNHTKNEINLSITKQNDYNNLFKEIEQLIYKRDFINLKILKQIKEKIIEVIKNNSKQICVFCKKSNGIKSKCMFPSCSTYFHIYCYYNKFLENCKKIKKLYIKNNLKDSNFYIVRRKNNKINIFQKCNKIIKKKKHLHNYNSKINRDIYSFNNSNKESLGYKKKYIKNEDLNKNNNLITINNNLYSRDLRKINNHTIQKKLNNSKACNFLQKIKKDHINDNNISHNSDKKYIWCQNNYKKSENKDELKLNYLHYFSHKNIPDKNNENLKRGNDSYNTLTIKKEECYNNKNCIYMKENKEKKESIYINLNKKYKYNVDIDKKKEKNHFLYSNKLHKKKLDLLYDYKYNIIEKMDNIKYNTEFEKEVTLENDFNKNSEKTLFQWEKKNTYKRKLSDETKYNNKNKNYDSFNDCNKIMNEDNLSSTDFSFPNSNEKNIYLSNLNKVNEKSSSASSLCSSSISTKYFSSSILTNKSSVKSFSFSSKSSYSSLHSSTVPSSSSSSSSFDSSSYHSNSYSYTSSSYPTSSSFVSYTYSDLNSSSYNSQYSDISSCEESFPYYKTKLQLSSLNNRYNNLKKTKTYEQNEIKNMNYEENNNFFSNGLLTCNLENVNNNNVYINTIKLTMCPLHNNETDIRTVMSLKMNALDNKKYNNLNNIFYYYYNSFLHSLFFSNKYIHIMKEEEAEEEKINDLKNQQHIKEQEEEKKKDYDNVEENNYYIEGEKKKQGYINKRKYNIKYDKKKNSNTNIVNDNKNINETNLMNGIQIDKFCKKRKKKKLNNLYSYSSDKMKNDEQSSNFLKKKKNVKNEFNIKNHQKLNSIKSEHEKNVINDDVSYSNQKLEKLEINTNKRKKIYKKEENKNINDIKLLEKDFNIKKEDTYSNIVNENFKGDNRLNKKIKKKKNQNIIKDTIIKNEENYEKEKKEKEKENENEKKEKEKENENEKKEKENEKEKEEKENENENENEKIKINKYDEIGKNGNEKPENVEDIYINESNKKNLQSFIKYIDKIIENVETSSIIKNNICEGIYYLRQQNGLNIFQKFNGRFKKQLKIQNKKKKKKKRKKNLGEINIMRKINVDIQKGSKQKNNNTDLKKKVNINKYSYLFYRLPLFIFGQKYVNDADNLKSIYHIKNFFQHRCEFDTSSNILSVIELLKSYSNHKMFKKSVILSNKTLNDKEEKSKINHNNIKLLDNNENEMNNLYNFKINSENNNTFTSCNKEIDLHKEKMYSDEIFYSVKKIKNDNTYLNENIDMNLGNLENLFFPNKKIHDNPSNETDIVVKDKKSIKADTDILNNRNFINCDKLENNENNIHNQIKYECDQTPRTPNDVNLSKKLKVCKKRDNNYNIFNDTYNIYEYDKNEDIDNKNIKIRNDELCKETLSHNKSYNIIFTLFDNGNNIYLLIYESEKDNRKKCSKNKQLKKNEFNNIDYFFNELYNNLYLKNSYGSISAILEEIFLNNINNNNYNNNNEKLNYLKIDGTVLNKNILQNILKNFNLFGISKNTSIKLVNIFELTYYDYLFIKTHKFFYSKKGVKIYDNCNNLYEIKNSENEGNEIKNDESGKLKNHYNLLSYQLNQIINDRDKENNNILNRKSIISNNSDIIDKNKNLKDNKVNISLNQIVPNLNNFDENNINVDIFENAKNINIDVDTNKNMRINKSYSNIHNNMNLNISYKNKILHKKISKNIYKKKNKHKKGNKKYFQIINRTSSQLNSVNINNNINNSINFIINEYINNKTYDNDIKEYLSDVIKKYNNFSIINEESENKGNVDKNKLLSTNSFSNFDIYKLFLLDNNELGYFNNNEDKKKYLNDIFLNKNILLNFKNSFVKNKQIEFFNMNINNKNYEEIDYNFFDIKNILCFENNRNNFMKKINKHNVEELEANSYINKNEEINDNDEIMNEENKNIKLLNSFNMLDEKNINADKWDVINNEKTSLMNNKDDLNFSLNCYKTNDTLDILIKNNNKFNFNFIKEEDSNEAYNDVKNNISNKFLNNLKSNLKKEEKTKFYDYFNENICNENFNMIIDNSYEKIKNLYDNLNEEIIKNKIILISKIIEENHIYNLSDMPIYVNFVFYKYSCVNNWNNLIHNLEDSFLKEEAYFFNLKNKNNKSINDRENSEILLESSNENNTIRNEKTKLNFVFNNDNKYVKQINEENKRHNLVSNTNNYVYNDENDENDKNNDITISNISTLITTTNNISVKANTSTYTNNTSTTTDNNNYFNKKNENETKEIPNNIIINKNETMNNAICSVCFNTETNNINILFKCISCSIYIHKYCYGIYQKNKNDDFLCDKCVISKSFKKNVQNEDLNKNIGIIKKKKKFNGNNNSNTNKNIDEYINNLNENDKNLYDNSNNFCDNKYVDDNKSFENFNCFICKKYGGALKKTTSKSFVHIFCVLFFISHVFCLNIYNLNYWNINNLRSFENICCICNQSGFVINCCYHEHFDINNLNNTIKNSYIKNNKCNKYFHPLCAYLEGYHMKVKIYDDKFITTFFYDNCFSLFKVTTYCNDHIPLGVYENRSEVKKKRNKYYMNSECIPLFSYNEKTLKKKDININSLNKTKCLYNKQNDNSKSPTKFDNTILKTEECNKNNLIIDIDNRNKNNETNNNLIVSKNEHIYNQENYKKITEKCGNNEEHKKNKIDQIIENDKDKNQKYINYHNRNDKINKIEEIPKMFSEKKENNHIEMIKVIENSKKQVKSDMLYEEKNYEKNYEKYLGEGINLPNLKNINIKCMNSFNKSDEVKCIEVTNNVSKSEISITENAMIKNCNDNRSIINICDKSYNYKCYEQKSPMHEIESKLINYDLLNNNKNTSNNLSDNTNTNSKTFKEHITDSKMNINFNELEKLKEKDTKKYDTNKTDVNIKVTDYLKTGNNALNFQDKRNIINTSNKNYTTNSLNFIENKSKLENLSLYNNPSFKHMEINKESIQEAHENYELVKNNMKKDNYKLKLKININDIYSSYKKLMKNKHNKYEIDDIKSRENFSIIKSKKENKKSKCMLMKLENENEKIKNSHPNNSLSYNKNRKKIELVKNVIVHKKGNTSYLEENMSNFIKSYSIDSHHKNLRSNIFSLYFINKNANDYKMVICSACKNLRNEYYPSEQKNNILNLLYFNYQFFQRKNKIKKSKKVYFFNYCHINDRKKEMLKLINFKMLIGCEKCSYFILEKNFLFHLIDKNYISYCDDALVVHMNLNMKHLYDKKKLNENDKMHYNCISNKNLVEDEEKEYFKNKLFEEKNAYRKNYVSISFFKNFSVIIFTPKILLKNKFLFKDTILRYLIFYNKCYVKKGERYYYNTSIKRNNKKEFICNICKKKSYSLIKCSFEKCYRAFHINCINKKKQFHKFSIEFNAENTYHIYCNSHCSNTKNLKIKLNLFILLKVLLKLNNPLIEYIKNKFYKNNIFLNYILNSKFLLNSLNINGKKYDNKLLKEKLYSSKKGEDIIKNYDNDKMYLSNYKQKISPDTFNYQKFVEDKNISKEFTNEISMNFRRKYLKSEENKIFKIIKIKNKEYKIIMIFKFLQNLMNRNSLFIKFMNDKYYKELKKNTIHNILLEKVEIFKLFLYSLIFSILYPKNMIFKIMNCNYSNILKNCDSVVYNFYYFVLNYYKLIKKKFFQKINIFNNFHANINENLEGCNLNKYLENFHKKNVVNNVKEEKFKDINKLEKMKKNSSKKKNYINENYISNVITNTEKVNLSSDFKMKKNINKKKELNLSILKHDRFYSDILEKKKKIIEELKNLFIYEKRKKKDEPLFTFHNYEKKNKTILKNNKSCYYIKEEETNLKNISIEKTKSENQENYHKEDIKKNFTNILFEEKKIIKNEKINSDNSLLEKKKNEEKHIILNECDKKKGLYCDENDKEDEINLNEYNEKKKINLNDFDKNKLTLKENMKKNDEGNIKEWNKKKVKDLNGNIKKTENSIKNDKKRKRNFHENNNMKISIININSEKKEDKVDSILVNCYEKYNNDLKFNGNNKIQENFLSNKEKKIKNKRKGSNYDYNKSNSISDNECKNSTNSSNDVLMDKNIKYKKRKKNSLGNEKNNQKCEMSCLSNEKKKEILNKNSCIKSNNCANFNLQNSDNITNKYRIINEEEKNKIKNEEGSLADDYKEYNANNNKSKKEKYTYKNITPLMKSYEKNINHNKINMKDENSKENISKKRNDIELKMQRKIKYKCNNKKKIYKLNYTKNKSKSNTENIIMNTMISKKKKKLNENHKKIDEVNVKVDESNIKIDKYNFKLKETNNKDHKENSKIDELKDKTSECCEVDENNNEIDKSKDNNNNENNQLDKNYRIINKSYKPPKISIKHIEEKKDENDNLKLKKKINGKELFLSCEKNEKKNFKKCIKNKYLKNEENNFIDILEYLEENTCNYKCYYKNIINTLHFNNDFSNDEYIEYIMPLNDTKKVGLNEKILKKRTK
ncbi:phd finger protein, putative [Plasmodium gallinaceum]|uniref:Phd finger protein, putative n=1 Tax=Plasmodium gallinaceum TaxID=5849 RepID=A0A1J1GSV0_PLAGA|nr:phd finger protein, putative [Plasmodium gallinaceum]CRG95328.1 phd finger protein, putative [Plasmodium gallinaceum]